MTNEERDNLLLSINEHMKKTDAILLKMNEKIDKMEERLERAEKDIRSISRSVAVIEHDHGGKIQMLLDGVSGINSRLDLFENRLDSHEIILEKHASRIYNLESEIRNVV